MNEHLLKGNEEKFKVLNITEWQRVVTGNGIKVGIIGFSPGAQHNGAWLINQVAPDCTIIEYNVMDKEPPRYTFQTAFEKMLEDEVDIVCSSLRKYSWGSTLESLSKQLYDNGVIMIDSADNEGREIDAYPAKSQYWFVAGAYNGADGRSGYSQYGEKLDFLMYTNFACKNINGDYLPISYTSGSTQVPCGIVALLKEFYGKNNFGPEEFRKYIQGNCIDLGADGRDDDTGYGLLILPAEVPKMKIEFQENKKEFYIDGEKKESRIAPFIKDGVMLVPLREFSEAFGATVQWDADTKFVTIIK